MGRAHEVRAKAMAATAAKKANYIQFMHVKFIKLQKEIQILTQMIL